MSELGTITLLLALVLASYSGLGSLIGRWMEIPSLVRSARYAVYTTTVMLSISTGILVTAFVTHDFELAYVAGHSSLSMDPWLTWVAFYAGNEGSLLFLATAFSGLSSLAVRFAGREVRPALAYTTTILMFILFFYIVVMLTMANPFAKLSVIPIDGQGINPLLTHPGMFFHPPILMTGLIGVGIPFAFAMGHLLANGVGDAWVGAARFWGLIIWTTLTIGLLLGGWWAYTILGWGGYWAWDPVENAGLLPWLPLTAFIHSIMVQKRRGVFRMWNVALIIMAWGFAMYGMFMNRGGPVPSVHSFGQSTMGWIFLVFLGVNLVIGFGLFFWRYSRLRSATSLDSVLSREASFLLNNILFLMVAFTVLWGVVYPLISQAFRGVMVTVGRPYFDIIAGPLFLALVVLMGIAPLLPWRHASVRSLIRALLVPITLGLATGLVLLVLGLRSPLPIITFSVLIVVVSGILREWVRGSWVRHKQGESLPLAFVRLVMSNRPRYGGYIAHLAIVCLAFSVTGSSFFSVQNDFSLLPGERVAIGGYEIEYLSNTTEFKADHVQRDAQFMVYKEDKRIQKLVAGYSFYPEFSMASTRAGIRTTAAEDLYIIASEFKENGRILVRIYVNPLVVWMWVSGPLLVLGALVALWPEPHRTSAQVGALLRRTPSVTTEGEG